MGKSGSDTVKELKACVIQLALYTGIGSHTITIQGVAARITDFSETKIRDAATELAESHSWFTLQGGEIRIEDRSAAKSHLKALRNELYS